MDRKTSLSFIPTQYHACYIWWDDKTKEEKDELIKVFKFVTYGDIYSYWVTSILQ